MTHVHHLASPPHPEVLCAAGLVPRPGPGPGRAGGLPDLGPTVRRGGPHLPDVLYLRRRRPHGSRAAAVAAVLRPLSASLALPDFDRGAGPVRRLPGHA